MSQSASRLRAVVTVKTRNPPRKAAESLGLAQTTRDFVLRARKPLCKPLLTKKVEPIGTKARAGLDPDGLAQGEGGPDWCIAHSRASMLSVALAPEQWTDAAS